MSDLPSITIPEELLPIDGRFGSGPSKVRIEAVLELAGTGASYLETSHRRDTARGVVARLRRGLAELFDLPEGYEVLLGVGGATAFWDAAAFGLVQRRSQHLVFGEFSGKFAAVTEGAPHLDHPDVVASAPGTYPHDLPQSSADLLAQTHNETSTGVMMPLRPTFRPERARCGRRHVGRWCGRGGSCGLRRLLLLTAESLRLGRRPLGCAVLTGGGRPHWTRRCLRPVGSSLSEPEAGARQFPEGPDLQHPRSGDTVPAAPPDRPDDRPRRLAWRGQRSGRSVPNASTDGPILSEFGALRTHRPEAAA